MRQFRYRHAFLTVIRALAEYEALLAGGAEMDDRFALTTLLDVVTGMLEAPDHTGTNTD